MWNKESLSKMSWFYFVKIVKNEYKENKMISHKNVMIFKVLILLFVLTQYGCATDIKNKENEDNQSMVLTDSFENLTKIELKDIDENSSHEDQMHYGIISAVGSGFNYSPSQNLTCKVSVSSPKMAYQQLILLKPETKELITCWGEYKGHYVFSLILNENESKDHCSFLSIYYIPIGGKVFWYCYPNT